MEEKITRTSTDAGFTLIELAMVLFIVGLLLVGLLSPLAVKVEQEERATTQASLDDIHEALIGFVLGNGRLPCPDTDTPADGVENPPPVGGSCPNDTGTLPWVTLGVEQLDAWGNTFLYRVTDKFAKLPTAGSNVSFTLADTGDITIKDAHNGNDVAISIPVVVLSHGKNRPQATDASVDEIENYEDPANPGNDVPKEIVSRTYDDTFDDMVSWISPNVLRARMVEAGLLP